MVSSSDASGPTSTLCCEEHLPTTLVSFRVPECIAVYSSRTELRICAIHVRILVSLYPPRTCFYLRAAEERTGPRQCQTVRLSSAWSSCVVHISMPDSCQACSQPHVRIVNHGRPLANAICPGKTIPLLLLVLIETYRYTYPTASSFRATSIGIQVVQGQRRKPYESLASWPTAVLSTIPPAPTGCHLMQPLLGVLDSSTASQTSCRSS